jgi:hypothetical protein
MIALGQQQASAASEAMSGLKGKADVAVSS